MEKRSTEGSQSPRSWSSTIRQYPVKDAEIDQTGER
jgi:hypothetical protein